MSDLNFYNDQRNCAAAKAPILFLDDGSEIELPTIWEVCPVCNGKGTHINPAIDCDGLTADDFAEDSDFLDDYFSGVYDQSCNKCQGRTTVPGVDWNQLPADQATAYKLQLAAEALDLACQRAELAMGA